MKHSVLITLVALSCILGSCTRGTVYSHYEPLPVAGWHADSALVYDFSIADSTAAYDIVLNIRHSDRYPFQNVWLFADLYRDSLLLSSDTLDYFLADARGRWIGNGFGNRRDMPMLYKQHTRFLLGGDYRLTLRQGMRDTLLLGVSDMGVTIEKAE